MGLCKCPKRKVTSLFCYVHKVNVCESCMVEQHPRVSQDDKYSISYSNNFARHFSVKCVVHSYVNWLEDSDFDPTCSLCSNALDQGEVIRLVCYGEVFHNYFSSRFNCRFISCYLP